MALIASVRDLLAIPIVFAVSAAIGIALIALLRLIGPGSILVERNRLPAWWHRFTAWARSRSLRIWCPDPETAAVVVGHLATPTGRRLSRLGVAIAQGPHDADVIVVAATDRGDLEGRRRSTPVPVASVVLSDPADEDEFIDALVRLSAALRWPEDAVVR